MPQSFRFRLVVGALAIAVVLPPLARAEGQPNKTTAEARDQEPEIQVSGIPQPGTSVRAGRAVGIVDASLDEVLAVVQDYGAYDKFMPHFKASRVLSRRGESALVYMQASIARDTMTLWCQLKVGPRPNIGTTHVIEAKMIEGNMSAMHARWEVTPVDAEHTRVAFELLMDPKVPLPASLVSNENEKASQKTIRALRHVVAERAALNAKR
jgi:ribosome-associated toxin RatA of RatAB toxin-antitoxin module